MINIPVIKIKCGAADCKSDLHAFNDREYTRLGKGRQFLKAGVCKECGTDAGIDWSRTHARDTNDIDYVVSALRNEYIRSVFWDRPFNDKCLAKAKLDGRAKIFRDARAELERTVGQVAHAGWCYMQVPTDDEKMRSVVQYAQHAVAACCRRCIHGWHGISEAEPLTQAEIGYLSALVQRYLDMRLPNDIPA